MPGEGIMQIRNLRVNLGLEGPKAIEESRVVDGDRRSHDRHVTILRVALLHTARSKELCVVRNISAGGLSARVYRTFAVGELVQVELKCDERIEGTVQWVRDCDIGIAFVREIEVEAVLTSRWVTEDGRRQRLPRIDLDCRCRLRVGSRFYLGTLRDISQGGAKVHVQRPFQGSGDAVLTLPELGFLESSVRWSHRTIVGLSFNERLPFTVLAHWLQKHRGIPDMGEIEALG
jgi:hypothetical protein